ncbi:hypothetical protein [Nocardia callitridis]
MSAPPLIDLATLRAEPPRLITRIRYQEPTERTNAVAVVSHPTS